MAQISHAALQYSLPLMPWPLEPKSAVMLIVSWQARRELLLEGFKDRKNRDDELV